MAEGLECRSVGFIHGDSKGNGEIILHEVCAGFHAGRVALITGPTGAGKSTLLHLLAGFLRPTSGTVYADGQPVSRWISHHRDLWRRTVGIVFQNHYFLHDLTVLENTIVPLVPCGFAVDELRDRGANILDKLGISHLAGKSISALSGGERQRLSMARALVGKPRFLLADEPTAHQDSRGCDIVFRCLEEAAKRNATVVVAAHDPRIVDSGIAHACWHLEGTQLERME